MITRDDLIKRFGEAELIRLTDRAHYATIKDEVLNAAIFDATEEAQSYLRAAGLSDDIAELAPIVKVKVCDIARYYLHEDGTTGIVEERYKQAINFFKDVMKNPTLLKVSSTAQPSTSGIAVISASLL